jgi:hypothetical protein
MKSAHLLDAVVFAALMTSAASGQPAPIGAKILHDASAVLETKKAFRGLLIVPHGRVDRTGNRHAGDLHEHHHQPGRIFIADPLGRIDLGKDS